MDPSRQPHIKRCGRHKQLGSLRFANHILQCVERGVMGGGSAWLCVVSCVASCMLTHCAAVSAARRCCCPLMLQDAIWQAEGVLLGNIVAAQVKLGQFAAAVWETSPDLIRK